MHQITRRLFNGPPWRLPVLLDTAAEWWSTRSPRVRQGLVTLLAVAAVGILARPRPHSWGPTTSVVVATSPLEVGDLVTAGHVGVVPWPLQLVPAGVVRSAESALGRRAASRVAPGQVLADVHLGVRLPADLAPQGWSATAVPTERLPPLPPGSVVDVHGGNGASVLGALVLEQEGDVLWLAVPRGQAATLAQALAWGPVHIAVWASDDHESGDGGSRT